MPAPVAAAAAGASGAGAWAPAIVGGSMGMASGLFKPSLKRQWKYMKKQMALQQQYALEQMDRQAALNYGNWQKQFDYENEYNKPTALFERYRAAGITPAAVLGSSGVGVNGTMSPGSVAGTSGASGPSGGSMDFSNPMAASAGYALEAMQVKSQTDLNKAMANNQQAQANSTNDQNVGHDRYVESFELGMAVATSGIDDVQSQIALRESQRAWQEIANKYAAQGFEADINKTLEECSKIAADVKSIKEHTRGIKAHNDAYIPYMEQQAAADLAYTLARNANLIADTSIKEKTAEDMQHWLNVHWNEKVRVRLVDPKTGKPTDQFKDFTGEEIARGLYGLDFTHSTQDTFESWFRTRSEKNALGYSMLQTLVQSAGKVAAAAALAP